MKPSLTVGELVLVVAAALPGGHYLLDPHYDHGGEGEERPKDLQRVGDVVEHYDLVQQGHDDAASVLNQTHVVCLL